MFDNFGEHLGYSSSVNVNQKTTEGWTAFSYACSNGMINTVSYLADEVEMDITILDKFDRSPLHWAARYNNQAMVTKLVQLGFEYLQQDEKASPLLIWPETTTTMTL